jgi:alpha-beta hydrolase superfamily lysophospholipase
MSQLKPSRLTERIVRLGLATRAGSFAASYLIARWLTKPARRAIDRTPSDFGLPWEPLTCTTADGCRLSGWLVTPPHPRATVLLFHGVTQTREQTLSRLAFLVSAGLRCLAVDHRAHGESTGTHSSFGYHERHDVRAVVELARGRWPDQPLAVLGVSMGAAAVAYAAADIRPHVRAVILESIYHDVVRAFDNRLSAGHYPDYFRALSHHVIRRCEARLRVRAEWLTPADRVADLAPVPFLLLTGAEDRHATPAEAEEVFARRRGPAELVLVPGADHEDVCEAGGDFNRRHVLEFLDRRLFTRSDEAA